MPNPRPFLEVYPTAAEMRTQWSYWHSAVMDEIGRILAEVQKASNAGHLQVRVPFASDRGSREHEPTVLSAFREMGYAVNYYYKTYIDSAGRPVQAEAEGYGIAWGFKSS